MKSRKATIKKPKFLVSYFISVIVLLAVFTTAGVIYFMPTYYEYIFNSMEAALQREDAIYHYIKEGIANPELTATDLVEARRRLIDHYCETGERYEVIVDGKYKLDTSRTAILDHTYIAEDGEESRVYLQLADREYLKYFDTPEVQGKSFIDNNYSGYFVQDSKIAFECMEYYADLGKGVFIPVSVTILNAYGDPTDVSFKTEPKDTEGMILINSEHDGFTSAQGIAAGDPSADGSLENIEHTEYESGNTFHSFNCRCTGSDTIPFNTAYKDQLILAVVLICCGAFIFAFIPATIVYNTRKRNYEIFEYRLKTTNAMAHDLKTPLAAIGGYAESLSYHIGSDKQEYYAEKIEDKVSQMTGMINNILEFSKSEALTGKVTTADTDIGSVIAEVIADNECKISSRDLKVNYDQKEVIVKTDKELFKQALDNLIGNAVLHSKEGTEIDITCDSKSVVIVNTAAEKIDDIKSIREPFVKGSESRGDNGSGLGLAIADNNLAMLRYKLEIKTEDDKFYAIVKLK